MNNMKALAAPETKDIGSLSWIPANTEPAIVVTKEEGVQIETNKEVAIAGWGMQTAEGVAGAATSRNNRQKICVTVSSTILAIWTLVGGDASTSRKCHGDSGGPTYMKVQTQSAEKWRNWNHLMRTMNLIVKKVG